LTRLGASVATRATGGDGFGKTTLLTLII